MALTIYFTQCCQTFEVFEPDAYSVFAQKLPIIPRLEYYKTILREDHGVPFFTYDEHMLLVAQWLKRTKAIARLTFVSVCSCVERQMISIPTNDEGDMLEDPHHGFFPQRLEYLR